MPFPNFDGKHAHDALVNPDDLYRWRVAQGLLPKDLAPPDAVILTYQPLLFDAAVGAEPTNEFPGPPSARLHTLDETQGRVRVIGRFGFGAPVAPVLIAKLASPPTPRSLTTA